jgi:hypothetical protein
MSVITLSSKTDEVEMEAGWSVLAGADAGERSAASVSVHQTNGAFLGFLERANKDTCASCQVA